jgi:hypothetical protein
MYCELLTTSINKVEVKAKKIQINLCSNACFKIKFYLSFMRSRSFMRDYKANSFYLTKFGGRQCRNLIEIRSFVSELRDGRMYTIYSLFIVLRFLQE